MNASHLHSSRTAPGPRTLLLLPLIALALLVPACDADTKSVGQCGDNYLDPGEECDGSDFGDATCGTLGHYNSVGHLGCNADCTYDLTNCGGFCGDGVLQLMYAEDCEGADLNGATCRSQGYHAGTLSCGDDCRFVTDLCTGIGNQRPAFSSTPSPGAQEDTQYVYSAACADPDGDDVTITLGDSDTCGGDFTSAGGSGAYTFTPTESQGGTSCTLHLSCADAEFTEHQMQVITIQEVNLAPAIANLPAAIDAAWALPTEFDVTAEDPDLPPNTLTYEITASTCGFDATINTYGRVAFTCLAQDETCDLTIRVTDNGAPAMSDTEHLTVTCANLDPTFITTPATTLDEHQEYVYEVTCDDPDGHSVTLTRGTDTCGGTYTPVTAGRAVYAFTPGEDRGGTSCEVVFYCTDTYGTVSQTAAFDIAETNSDPLFDNLPGTAAALWGRTGAFTATAHDIDTPAQTFDYGFVSTTCAFPVAVDPDTGEVSWTCGDPGVCEATLSATDSLGAVSTATLQIQCTNRTPVFLTNPVTRAREDDETVINVSCRDLDNDARTLSLAAGHTCGGTLQDLGNGFAQIRFTPTAAMGGTCTFAVTCADAHASVDQTATLTIDAPMTWTMVSAGATHACAIESGNLFCWGNSTYGKLGDDSAPSHNFPLKVSGEYSDWSSVSVSSFHSCGIRAGHLFCWGRNNDTQLGDNTGADKATPTEVYGAHADWSLVTAGTFHTCGLRNTRLYCWGENEWGTLGDGTTTRRSVPTEVSGSYTNWQTASAGTQHTCGIRNGRAYCWGLNVSGQLGTNNTTMSITPVEVYGSYTNWIEISAADAHTCGIRGGRLYCWGNNSNGRLGDGSTTNRLIPTEVSGNYSDWSSVTTGAGHTCAIRQNRLFCWGRNDGRQLGDGTTIDRSAPVEVSGYYEDWSSVSGGQTSTCGIKSNRVFCWGTNSSGQLGDGTILPSASPVSIDTIRFTPWLFQWKTCGIRNGRGLCWGTNSQGQLGTGDTTDKIYATQISDASDQWVEIILGTASSCGIRAGSVYCWGRNSDGQLGDGTLLQRLTPTIISGGYSDWDALAVGDRFTCAIRQGRRYCWGYNNVGQLGDDTLTTKTVPSEYSSSSIGWSQISAGNGYACGIQNGIAYCWGSNSGGRLGNGTVGTGSYIPEAVEGGYTDWMMVNASFTSHTCGIRQGRAYCWGSNVSGQLGNGSTSASFVPSEVSGGHSDWSWIYAFENAFSCGVRAGALYCWGSNTGGQLGDGSTINRLTPTLVLGGFSDWQLRSGNYGLRNGTLYSISQTINELYY